MKTNLEILQACCSTEPTRYKLDKPFLKLGVAYGTNGHICARLRTDIPPEIKEVDGTPPCADLGWDKPYPQLFLLPKVGPDKSKICPKCWGSGYCTCVCGDEHKCQYCDGEGDIDVIHNTRVGPAIFADKYIRLLTSFGVTGIGMVEEANLPAQKPAYWQAPGGVDGILMPCSSEGDAE